MKFSSLENDTLDEQLYAAEQEIERLKQAIRNHRDQRGDDRCWLDDQQLYAALKEPIPETAGILPEKERFLANCEHYFQCRRKNDTIDTGDKGRWMSRAELEEFETGIREEIALFLSMEAQARKDTNLGNLAALIRNNLFKQ